MNSNCKQFRIRLRAALEGGLRGETAALEAVRPLSWHEHLFTCTGCRDLLEAEEALEELLTSLPAPALPKKLAKRILERLEIERAATGRMPSAADLDHVLTTGDSVDVPTGLAARVLAGIDPVRREESVDALDMLLCSMPSPEPPAGLAARVLDRVNVERELALDALLDLVPAPRIPAELADTILDILEAERASTEAAPILRPSFGALQYVAAIAATLVVAFGAWRLASDANPGTLTGGEREGMVREGDANRDSARNGTTENVAARDVDEPSNRTDRPDPSHAETPTGIDVIDAELVPNPGLLASLDVLEDWELLMSDDIDVLLGSLDEADAELLFLIEETEYDSSSDPEEG